MLPDSATVLFQAAGLVTLSLIRDHVFTDFYFTHIVYKSPGSLLAGNGLHFLTQILFINIVCLLHCICSVMNEPPGDWEFDMDNIVLMNYALEDQNAAEQHLLRLLDQNILRRRSSPARGISHNGGGDCGIVAQHFE
jgi:hypothetical protein